MSDLSDPRVFFAAERTLLAWSRTSLTLMGFGFVIERFGLFLHAFAPDRAEPLQRSMSFWVGLAFILLGVGVAAFSAAQYRAVLKSLTPGEIPVGYRVNAGVVTNLVLAVLGLVMSGYLFSGLA